MTFRDLIILIYIHLIICTIGGIIDENMFCLLLSGGLLILNMILHAFYEWKIKEMIGDD